VSDNFVRGAQFDGATGQKDGATLEDLVTLATFAVGSAALDQTTIEDDGAGKARIKDLGVSTAKVAANAITDAKIRQGAARSVIGVAGNATADVADITAGTDGHILRRSGTSIAFGQIVAAGITDGTITAAKLATGAVAGSAYSDVSGIIGRLSDGSGTVQSATTKVTHVTVYFTLATGVQSAGVRIMTYAGSTALNSMDERGKLQIAMDALVAQAGTVDVTIPIGYTWGIQRCASTTAAELDVTIVSAVSFTIG